MNKYKEQVELGYTVLNHILTLKGYKEKLEDIISIKNLDMSDLNNCILGQFRLFIKEEFFGIFYEQYGFDIEDNGASSEYTILQNAWLDKLNKAKSLC